MEMWTNNSKSVQKSVLFSCDDVISELIMQRANATYCICNFILMTWLSAQLWSEQLCTVNITALTLFSHSVVSKPTKPGISTSKFACQLAAIAPNPDS